MKFVNLRAAAYVNGDLRHPHEGTLHLTDEEADRLLEEGLADDVSADFSDVQDDEAPTESISAPSEDATTSGKATKA